MNKTAIKNFAIWARNKLISDISYRAGLMGITAEGIQYALPQSTGETEFYDIGTAEPYAISGEAVKQRRQLVEVIHRKERDSDYQTAYKYIIEEVAYTWFNRLIAVRFMEVNEYLPSRVRVLSSETGKLEPDLVTNPFDAELPFTDREEQKIMQLGMDNQVDELFRLLFIKQCNVLNEILPALFEKTNDYTELLLNLSVIDEDGVVYHLVHDIPENDFNVAEEGQIEIIGWLYQYYISERHDDVVNINKGAIKTEDVPAATQLFTTDWVVRYMVDNSLGRYWIERNPNSILAEKLDFFVTPQNDHITNINEKIEPQELTVFDPCMGSGHILVYAFDVLMEVYKECGFSERDAASAIIEYNISGLDVDKRAMQLAYFAVMMKARQYDRRFLERGIKPQIYCAEGYLEGEILGSLVKVESLEAEPEEPQELTLFNMDFEQKRHIWEFRKLLTQKHAAVCTNPPYLNKYNNELKKYIIENYKDYSGDLFSVFMYRNFDFCKPDGYSAFMTPFVWMFIKTYEKLREYIIRNKSIVSLIQMEYSAFEEATVPICAFVLKNRKETDKGLYFRLSDFKGGMEVQKQKVLEAINDRDCGYFYEVWQNNFVKIPGSPIAYWLSEKAYGLFNTCVISKLFVSGGRNKTHGNEKYVRFFWEIEYQSKSWRLYLNGGEYRKYYGSNNEVVLWTPKAQEEYRSHGGLLKSDSINGIGVYWNKITSNVPGFCFKKAGWVFSSVAPAIIEKDENSSLKVLAFLNSVVASYFLKAVNPTMTTNQGDILSLPFIDTIDVKEKVEECIRLSKADWDSFETSWDFQQHPLVTIAEKINKKDSGTVSRRIEDAFLGWNSECYNRFIRLKANEEQFNSMFIDIYGLQNELTPEVEDKDVTVRKANLQRDIKSLLSYAVGCMFGRYSLDVDGLAYAGGDWDGSKYSTFIPDKDNVIPITDEEYLEDDIVGLLCAWLKKVYGAETLEENLDFIAAALGNKGGASREIIRNYFLNDFMKDHIKVYQKRPIYWLFDSGKQNGFKALIYLHRYTPDTIGNLRIDYLHQMQRIYESEINRMQDMIDHSTNAREVATATKRKEKLQKQLKECHDYDEKIAHLALSRIELDLDDGVKVNYEKVQTARDGKKYQVLTKI